MTNLQKFLERAKRTKAEFGTPANEFLFKTAYWPKVISALKEANKILKEVEAIPNDRNEDISDIACAWQKKWDKEFADDIQ